MNFELYVIFFPLWENPTWCICSIWRAEPESFHTWCLCCSLLIGHCFLCSVGMLFNSILMTQNEDLPDAPPHWWRPLVARCVWFNELLLCRLRWNSLSFQYELTTYIDSFYGFSFLFLIYLELLQILLISNKLYFMNFDLLSNFPGSGNFMRNHDRVLG